MSRLVKSLIGRVFGRVRVISRGHSKKVPSGTRLYWNCRCDCGKEFETEGASLRMGRTNSCGCLSRDSIRRVGIANRTHGMTNTRTYASWRAMRRRCLEPGTHAYERYGGRGITVCAAWRDSFDVFLRDMGERPAGKTLDRYPNNDGNYEPGNCRWATPVQQNNNRRKRKVTA